MKVLVANDGSLHADNALDEVLASPWPDGSKFHLITVIEPLNVGVDSSFGELGELALEAQKDLDKDLEKALKDRQGRLAEKFGQANVSAGVVSGKAADEIIKMAKNWGAELIAIGSHGHNGFTEGWLGSVAQAVIKQAPCTVEVLRGLTVDAMEIEAEKPLEELRYLVAVNTEIESDGVIEAVLARPWPPESRFRVVTVVSPTARDLFADGIKNKQLHEVADRLHRAKSDKAEEMVKAHADRLVKKFGKDKVTYHALSGNAIGMILQTACDWSADLIVMGAHDRDKNLLEVFVGGVAQAVVVNAPCSVELVRSAR